MVKSTSPDNALKRDFVYQFAATKALGEKDTTCYAARYSGLHFSTDGGVTWRSAFASLNMREGVSALAVVTPPDPEDEPCVFVGVNGGILHSLDDGQTWESVLRHSPPPAIATLAISPDFIHDGTLFAGSLEDGVFRSSDRGRQWTAWNFGLMDLETLCLAVSPNFANDETLFVGTQSGIFRSTNGGRAWREVELPIGFSAVLSLAFSPDFARDATLFAGTEKWGLMHSTDAGETWVRLAGSGLSAPINGILLGPAYSMKPALLVLHGGAPLASQDGGNAWKAWRENQLTGKDVAAVFAPNGFGPRAPALVGYVDGTIQRV